METYPSPNAPHPQPLTLTDIVLPLYRCRGWMRLVGVMMLVGGILQCLTLIGLLYGWLPIWMGILLLNAASAIEQAHDRQDVSQIVVSQHKLALYFKITGVLLLAGLFLAFFAILIMVLAPAFLLPLLEQFGELPGRAEP